MRREFIYMPIITILTVIGVYTLAQNATLKNQAIESEKRAVIATKQRDELQKTADQNQAIAKQNRSYTRCIGEVFAKYTRDGIPITNLDLDTCTTDSQTRATDNTPAGGTSPADASSASLNTPHTSSANSPSAQSAPSSSPPQPNNSQPTTQTGIPLIQPVLQTIPLPGLL